MSEQDDDVSLETLLEMHRDAVAEDLHTTLIGRVESYDANAETADVVPMVRRALRCVDDSLSRVQMPTLRAVRVMPLRFGDFFIHARLVEGDFVLVVCMHRDHARFFQTGETSDPLDLRQHHLANAIAIPCGYPRSRKLPDSRKAAGELTIGHVAGAVIRIGADGVVKIEDATEVQAAGTAELSKFAQMDEHLSAIAADLDAIALAAGTTAVNYGATAKAALDVAQPIATEKLKGS